MKKIIYINMLAVLVCACAKTEEGKVYSDELTREAVITATDDAMAWQVGEFNNMDSKRKWKERSNASWANATFLAAAAEWSWLRADTATQRWVRACALAEDYRLLNGRGVSHVYHADNLIIGMFYADLYEQDGDERVIWPTVERVEFIKNHPSPYGLAVDTSDHVYRFKQRWSWCDALYMAPQVFARIAHINGDPSLLDFMDREYWFTTDYLYSREYHLYWRDSNYFDKLEANGKPVFWGRGNGWVVGGLARMIPYLPEDWEPRERYIKHFQDMMQAIVAVQAPEGHWHVTMLDPESYPTPEMSSTGFICYAMWWGINTGILDEATYLEPATRAWKSIIHAMHSNGMLGNVQAVGEKPEAISADMTEVYGCAAMTLAAMEILKYLDK